MHRRIRRRMTLLELVQVVQRRTKTEEELVAMVTMLVNGGRVTLCGNFASCRL